MTKNSRPARLSRASVCMIIQTTVVITVAAAVLTFGGHDPAAWSAVADAFSAVATFLRSVWTAVLGWFVDPPIVPCGGDAECAALNPHVDA